MILNIFYTNVDPKQCAIEHTNKHLISQIKESCQLLSTAHRVLDGVEYIDSSSGRKIRRWKLDDCRDKLLYKATHCNHPSAVWVRQSRSNYLWLVNLLSCLCSEYTYRYNKIHKCEQIGLVDMLFDNIPNNLGNNQFTEPTPAMPENYVVKNNSLLSYQKYVRDGKKHLHAWKGREVPTFI